MSTSDYTSLHPPAAIQPLPWRRQTPLNKKLGVRSLRFVYPGGAGLPVTATPASLQLRYGPEIGLDRLIGYSFACDVVGTASQFYLKELNTGWFQVFNLPTTTRLFVQGNLETLVDGCNLQWYCTNAVTPTSVYLSLMNIELAPWALQS